MNVATCKPLQNAGAHHVVRKDAAAAGKATQAHDALEHELHAALREAAMEPTRQHLCKQGARKKTHPWRWCGRSHRVSMLSTMIGLASGGAVSSSGHSCSGSMPGGSSSCGASVGGVGSARRRSASLPPVCPHGMKMCLRARRRRSSSARRQREAASDASQPSRAARART